MIREISIDFNKGSVTTREDKIPFSTTIMFDKDDSLEYRMKQLFEWVMIDTHFKVMTRGMTLEQLSEYFKNSPCDHPDCPEHPYTWGKTQKELNKTYQKDFKEYYKMEELKL